MRAREHGEGRRLIDDLLGQGFQQQQLHVYGRELPEGLPVEATRWRSTAMAILPGAVIGAVALPTLWQLLFKAQSDGQVMVLALIGAAVVGAGSLLLERGRASPMNAQQSAMRSGELMIAAEVDDDRVPEITRQISRSHPEVSMLEPRSGGFQARRPG